MPRTRSFPPLARPSARVLILGSMPGLESLRRKQYYAHPHNQFWPIMGALVGANPDLPYAARVRVLLAHHVAVWDVLKFCEREGSLDGSIVRASEVPHDFAGFLRRHPGVRAVFFNGGHSESAFRRHVLPRLGERARLLHFERLPSTSPAHAGMPRAAKLEAWRRVLEFL
jgi:double-stranded uracil-DNA glycosylase